MATFDLQNPEPIAGDALRDEAANLLFRKYGSPQREKRVDGKKVDLFFVHREHGKDVHYFVEAKDYAHHIGRSEANAIWGDYEPLLNRSSTPGVLLLITRRGLSPDGQAYVDSRPQMRHQTIWELENEMLGLTEYIRSLQSLFEADGLENYYVEGRARRISYGVDEERQPAADDILMFDELLAWLEEDTNQPVAILGGYGAGKSSLAKRLVAHQAQRALADPLARRPVLIRLGAFTRFSSLEGMLGGMFTHDFPVAGFNTHHFLEVSDKGRLLAVLDGFDEMKHAMTWADFKAQARTLNRLTQGRSKVVLLGRPSAFTSAEEQHHVLRGMKRFGDGWRRLPDWPEFREFDLEAFSPVERADFVRRYLGYLSQQRAQTGQAPITHEDIEARAAEVNRLADLDPEMFSKPVHAKILTDLAADLTVDLSKFSAGVSRWQLYEIFFESLAERESEKDARREIGPESRLEFLREVAFWLWSVNGGRIFFTADELPDGMLTTLDMGGAPDLDALKREYLAGAFLEKKSGSTYFFGHRSFAEFLVAQRMVLTPPRDTDQPVYSAMVKGGVETFLREAPDRPAICRWEDTLSNARGSIHLEYLSFLADAHGGLTEFIQALPSTSIWRPVLEVFSTCIELDDAAFARVKLGMLGPQNEPFFLLLSLYQLYVTAKALDPREAVADLAAIVLERVFCNAQVDDIGKAHVELAFDAARQLASVAVAQVVDRYGTQYLTFRCKALAQARLDWERKYGVDLSAQGAVQKFGLAADFEFEWLDIKARMDPIAGDAAARYFRRAKDMKGVFTRQARRGSAARGSSFVRR